MTSLESPSAEGERLFTLFADALNRRDYDALDDLLSEDFTDHHPGFVDVYRRDVYKRNLKMVIEALEMQAEAEDVVFAGDKVLTRIRLTGRHVGRFLGLEPTGNVVAWYTNELWRIENGKLVERWAVDDLYGLLGQLGVALPQWEDPV